MFTFVIWDKRALQAQGHHERQQLYKREEAVRKTCLSLIVGLSCPTSNLKRTVDIWAPLPSGLRLGSVHGRHLGDQRRREGIVRVALPCSLLALGSCHGRVWVLL